MKSGKFIQSMEVIRKFTVYEPFSRVYEPGKCLPLAAHALLLLLDVFVAHVGFLGGGLLGGGAGGLLLGLDLGPSLGAGTTDGLDDPPLPLLGVDLGHGTLLVLSPVEDGPGDFTGVLLALVEDLGLAVDEVHPLAVGLDEGLAMAGEDL